MNREKHKKFHETLLKILYPPPLLSSVSHQEEDSHENPNSSVFDVLEEEDKYCSSFNDDDDDESAESSGSFEKLTRAQRKKIRRKKLASQPKRKIIGPLLPDNNDTQGTNIEEDYSEIEESKTADTKLKKNRRRMAKRAKRDTTVVKSSSCD
ncbi:hypothetical protein ACHQM5_024839 [Ranunculus cassubicifolius]